MNGSAAWRVAAASVEGTSHAKLGTPCQDAVTVKFFNDADGREVLVVVVSDGAGSAKRSDIGSMLACSTIAEAVEVFLAESRRVVEIDRAVAETWLAMVRKAIVERAAEDGEVPREYACTLLAAVVGQDAAAFMQIGDGATVIFDGEGWAWIHWPQHGEYLNTTNFVTADNARECLDFDLCEVIVDELAVFTDGLEGLVLHQATKTVFSPFFDRMIPAVRACTAAGLDAGLSEALASYLTSPPICARTDDDKSLVLATRRIMEKSPQPAS